MVVPARQFDSLSALMRAVRIRCTSCKLQTYGRAVNVGNISGGPAFYWLIGQSVPTSLKASGISTSLEEGDLVFVTSSGDHEFVFENRPPIPTAFEIQILPCIQVFVAELILGEADLNGLTKLVPPMLTLKSANQQDFLKGILGLLRREVTLLEAGHGVMVDSMLQILFTQVVRHHKGLGEDSDCDLFQLPWEISSTLQLMREHLHLPWTVEALADAVGLSRSQFAMMFANTLDQSPMRYLFECRMVRARELLQNSHFALKEIAPMVGYKTTSAFSTAFKRWSGRPPMEERLPED